MEEILKQIAEPLGTLVLLLVNAGLALAVRWIHSKTKNENARLAADTVKELVATEVVRLNQQMVDALKNDGKFTDTEKKAVHATAMAAIKKQLPAATKKAAGYLVQDLDTYLTAAIERAVVDAKAAKPPTPPTT